MKFFVLRIVVMGMIFLLGVGCSNSELGSSSESQLAEKDIPLDNNAVAETQQNLPGETLTTYLHGVQGKLDQLKDKHAKLVGQVKEVAPGSESTKALDTILVELTKKGEEVQFQIEAMKSAKSEDQLALKTGMDKSLADLAQSYDDALAQFVG